MADPNKIAQVLEQFEVPADIVEEVFQELSASPKPTHAPVAESDDALRLQMLNEKDWRKRASIAALLISRSLS